MAPDVDVRIGEEPEYEEKSFGLGVKQFVDQRLKSIDLDDMGKISLHKTTEENEMLKNPSDDIEEEKIELPTQNKKEESVVKNDEPAVMPSYEAPRPDKSDLYLPVETSSMVKVYVGKYSNKAQADVAKDILIDSGMDVSPFVKNLNGTYTLQIGSFNDRARAEQVARYLTKNGFPARIVQE